MRIMVGQELAALLEEFEAMHGGPPRGGFVGKEWNFERVVLEGMATVTPDGRGAVLELGLYVPGRRADGFQPWLPRACWRPELENPEGVGLGEGEVARRPCTYWWPVLRSHLPRLILVGLQYDLSMPVPSSGWGHVEV